MHQQRAKKVRDELPENKRGRKHRAEAKKQLKRTADIKDGTYSSGVSCKKVKKKRKVAAAPKNKCTRKLCDCGQREPHKSSRYKHCGQNKKKLLKLADSEAPKSSSDCVSISHTHTVLDTTKLT